MSEDPIMRPAIVRRVGERGVQILERRAEEGLALCVFWSKEHAEEATRSFAPAAEGWRASDVDQEKLRIIFDVILPDHDLIYLEPHPDDPDLCGAFEPDVFIEMLDATEVRGEAP
jgi:hypothetical protein